MKFFVKNDKGELVEATTEQVLDPKTQLYNEEGELLSKPGIKTKEDPVEELTGVIKELAEQVKGVGAIKEKVEEMEAQIAVYKEAA